MKIFAVKSEEEMRKFSFSINQSMDDMGEFDSLFGGECELDSCKKELSGRNEWGKFILHCRCCHDEWNSRQGGVVIYPDRMLGYFVTGSGLIWGAILDNEGDVYEFFIGIPTRLSGRSVEKNLMEADCKTIDIPELSVRDPSEAIPMVPICY